MEPPVYTAFKSQARNLPELSDEHKKTVIEQIKSLNQDGKDILYLLIRYYATEVTKDSSVYGAKYQRKGIVLDFEQFPTELQQIIRLFVKKHLEETLPAFVEIVFG
jgi:hypothetical protein